MIDSSANLDTTACYLVPSLPNLSRNIGSWRQKKNQAPPTLKKENGYMTPKFLENGENFNRA